MFSCPFHVSFCVGCERSCDLFSPLEGGRQSFLLNNSPVSHLLRRASLGFGHLRYDLEWSCNILLLNLRRPFPSVVFLVCWEMPSEMSWWWICNALAVFWAPWAAQALLQRGHWTDGAVLNSGDWTEPVPCVILSSNRLVQGWKIFIMSLTMDISSLGSFLPISLSSLCTDEVFICWGWPALLDAELKWWFSLTLEIIIFSTEVLQQGKALTVLW